MKQALLIAAVDGRIGGVMVFGDRGTGKSTAVRALAALLPGIPVRPGCRYSCDPRDDGACPFDCPVGSGRPLVRSMRASTSRSWSWFRAEHPQESRNAPARARPMPSPTGPTAMSQPPPAPAEAGIQLQII